MKHWTRFAAPAAISALALVAAFFGLARTASASAQGSPDGITFEPAVTVVAERIRHFHDFVTLIIVVISLFVLALLLAAMVLFNRRANPTPKTFTHNMFLEVVWTVVPVFILVAIASQSFPLLVEEEIIPKTEVTLKVTGNSWFWNFEYPDYNVSVTSTPMSKEDVDAYNAAHPEDRKIFLLSTNDPVYVPADTYVDVLVTSNDVIHSFAMPAFGIKEDAIQGRVNETWFNVDSSRLNGDNRTFYGQCSELCGKDHSFMPIEFRVVSRAEFDSWVASQGGHSALASTAPPEQQALNTPAAAPAAR